MDKSSGRSALPPPPGLCLRRLSSATRSGTVVVVHNPDIIKMHNSKRQARERISEFNQGGPRSGFSVSPLQLLPVGRRSGALAAAAALGQAPARLQGPGRLEGLPWTGCAKAGRAKSVIMARLGARRKDDNLPTEARKQVHDEARAVRGGLAGAPISSRGGYGRIGRKHRMLFKQRSTYLAFVGLGITTVGSMGVNPTCLPRCGLRVKGAADYCLLGY